MSSLDAAPQSVTNSKDGKQSIVLLSVTDLEATVKCTSRVDFYSQLVSAIRKHAKDVVFNDKHPGWKSFPKNKAGRRSTWVARAKSRVVSIQDSVKVLPHSDVSKKDKHIIDEKLQELLEDPLHMNAKTDREIINLLSSSVTKFETKDKDGKADVSTPQKQTLRVNYRIYHRRLKALVDNPLKAPVDSPDAEAEASLQHSATETISKIKEHLLLPDQLREIEDLERRLRDYQSEKAPEKDKEEEEEEGPPRKKQNRGRATPTNAAPSGKYGLRRIIYENLGQLGLLLSTSNTILNSANKSKLNAILNACVEDEIITQDKLDEIESFA